MVILALLALCAVSCFAVAGMRRSGSPGWSLSNMLGSFAKPTGSPIPRGWKKGRWQFA